MKTYSKWLLTVIIFSMFFSAADLTISMYHRLALWSMRTTPAAGFVTILYHSISLYVWRKTAKRRKNMSRSSILSATNCTCTCLLALLWLAVGIITCYQIGLRTSLLRSTSLGVILGLVEGILGIVNSLLMWAEFGIAVHQRKRFWKKYASRSDGGGGGGGGRGSGEGYRSSGGTGGTKGGGSSGYQQNYGTDNQGGNGTGYQHQNHKANTNTQDRTTIYSQQSIPVPVEYTSPSPVNNTNVNPINTGFQSTPYPINQTGDQSKVYKPVNIVQKDAGW
ncbi:hypothetical protein FRC17_009443 [Serendipita sp. 399]|nr:hypothetical protein FRC17_009443 [Serendipita sp. 399]